jgi:predicted dehydrogenase
MDAEFRVAVIGCGARGIAYANAWNNRDDATVVSVFDPWEERKLELGEEMGAKPCDSYEEAIQQKEVNAVAVCTPVCYHSEVTVCAAENGCHVVSEKPMALSVEQADAMIDACRENDVLLTMGLQRRADYRNRKYKEMFENGEFGSPLFFRFQDMRSIRPKIAMHRRSQNNGPVVDMLCHFMDQARFVTGEEPVNVRCTGYCYAEDKPPVNEVPDPAIDAAAVQVEMTGGHVVQVFLNWGMALGFPGFGGELIVGPEIAAEPAQGGIEVHHADHSENWRDPGEGLRGADACVDWLVQGVKGTAEPACTGEDGRAALEVSLAALESIETGETVEI